MAPDMNVNVKIFPIAGLNESTQVMDITLNEGSPGELLEILSGRLGADPRERSIMVLVNGQCIDVESDVVLSNGDMIWLMPRLSGG